MKILICPDKFKGSLTADEVCEALTKGISTASDNCKIYSMPMSDGGEGALSVIKRYLSGEITVFKATDPLGRDIGVHVFVTKEEVYIETSLVIGLGLIHHDERNPMHTSTYGLGTLIFDILIKGYKHIHLFLGGSATNDGGAGMACALGYRFADATGKPIEIVGKNLLSIEHIGIPVKNLMNNDVKFYCYTDVHNNMHGLNGAAYSFSQQKGASLYEMLLLDKGLKNLSAKIKRYLRKDVDKIPGAGAAGGLGAGCCAFLNAEIRSGVDFFMELTKLKTAIKNADLIISGEGKIDQQSLQGKVISGVSKVCIKYRKHLILVAGQSTISQAKLKNLGVSKLVTLASYCDDMDTSVRNAGFILKKIGQNIGKTL